MDQRKKQILDEIVAQYIRTYEPVGSKLVSSSMNLSSASIRNEMVNLQHLGLIYVPHTSAGRIPTTEGYRMYVEELMPTALTLTLEEKQLIDQVHQVIGDIQEKIKVYLGVLAKLTKLLAFTVQPNWSNVVLCKIDFVRLSTQKVLLILTVQPGLVRTYHLEVSENLTDSLLQQTSRFLNEYFSGKTLVQLHEALQDIHLWAKEYEEGLQLLIQHKHLIFESHWEDATITYDGFDEIITQPEFKQAEPLHELMFTIENQDNIKSLVQQTHPQKDIVIGLNPYTQERFSLVQARYTLGEAEAYLGVIGPQRMNYAKVHALVHYTASQVLG